MNFEKLTNQLQKSIGECPIDNIGQRSYADRTMSRASAMLDNVEGGTSAIFELDLRFRNQAKLNDEIKVYLV